jgi:transglutaminase-like putative cysteine protease
MRFDLLHRLVTAAVIWTGFASLFLSGEFNLLVVVPSFAIPLVGVFAWRRLIFKHSGPVAGVVAVIAGVAAAYMAFISTDYLFWAIVFAIFLTSLKSIFLRSWTDFMQMYALSFLSVMAAAVVNPSISFGLLMFPFIVFLVFGLMLNNLRQGMELTASKAAAAGEDVDPAAFMAGRGIIKRRFVLITLAITTAVFLAGIVFFFLFPRLGLGFFAKQQRNQMAMTGFSDEVTLGDFGNIFEDPQVVIRVDFRRAKPSSALMVPLRFKGQSLDTYDGRSWRKTTSRRGQFTTSTGGLLRSPDFSGPLDGRTVAMMDVYLEPMSGNPRVLFGLTSISGFRQPSGTLDALRPEKWRFYSDSAGDVTLTGPDAVAIIYTVESTLPVDKPTLLKAAGTDYPADIRDVYLPVPVQESGVKELALSMTAGLENPYDKAKGIETRLRSGWAYSLSSVHGNTDPLADFLLRNKTGHCEYFASGMVVMLRVLGIPARIVNGFYGGVRNDYGGYVALRKSDAHSWVEVYFPGQGWAVFDPTPPSAFNERLSKSLLAGISEAIDATKLAWYRWVIEYDLEKQMEFLSEILKIKKENGSAFGDSINISDMRKIAKRLKHLPWEKIFGIPLLVIVAVAVARRLIPRLRGRGNLPGRVSGAIHYRAVKRMLGRRGFSRMIGETQLEFARRAGLSFPDAADALESVAWQYVTVLAGHLPVLTAAELDDAVVLIEHVLKNSGITKRTRPAR